MLATLYIKVTNDEKQNTYPLTIQLQATAEQVMAE